MYGYERFFVIVKEINFKIYQVIFYFCGKGIYKVWLVYSGLVVKGMYYFVLSVIYMLLLLQFYFILKYYEINFVVVGLLFIIEIDELILLKVFGDGFK